MKNIEYYIEFNETISNTDKFIQKAKDKHGDKYDYSDVKYVKTSLPVDIICKKHGKFYQRPNDHLSGHGCKQCHYDKNGYNKEIFIKKAKDKHGDKYDYSEVEYLGSYKPIKIVCKIHGEFLQMPYAHISGNGCPKCARSYTTDEFIDIAKNVHGDKYDYSNTNYKKSYKNIDIICKDHGIFTQRASSHLQGLGCPKCGTRKPYINDIFIKKAKDKHGDKYDYSKTDYNGSYQPVKIICKIHGEFSQSANSHINGSGCPICRESKGENYISLVLKYLDINYKRNFKFDECVSDNYRKLPFDFYLPDFNVCIEYDGMQHFEPIVHFGGNARLERQKYLDNIKTKYCDKNNIKLLRISYKISEYDSILDIIKNYLFSSS